MWRPYSTPLFLTEASLAMTRKNNLMMAFRDLGAFYIINSLSFFVTDLNEKKYERMFLFKFYIYKTKGWDNFSC